jgi:DNA-binding NtrC family response regulator
MWTTLDIDGKLLDEVVEASGEKSRSRAVNAMPDMNGDKLAAAIKLAAPATPVIAITGFGDLMEAAGERREKVDLVLKKPVTLRLLRKALAEVAAR